MLEKLFGSKGGLPSSDERANVDKTMEGVPEDFEKRYTQIIEEHYGKGKIVTEDPLEKGAIYRNLDPEGQKKRDELFEEYEA